MKCNILAICDEEKGYSELLTKQWLRQSERKYQICRFSQWSQLEEFASQNQITCLVVSESQEKLVGEIQAKVYFYLTSNKEKEEESKENQYYIYRYQSADSILNRIQEVEGVESVPQASGNGGMESEDAFALIGVYNPVHRNGQTTFAKALARQYSKQGKRVLYLSMEEYAGITRAKEGYEGLGEVLYYLKQDVKNISMRLAAFAKEEQGYEYVEPIYMSHELRRITRAEWMEFLEEVKGRSGYHRVILDLDSCIQGFLEVLMQCNRIYMPIREEVGGEDKRKQFLENLTFLKMEELEERIRFCPLPELEGMAEEAIGETIEKEIRRKWREVVHG